MPRFLRSPHLPLVLALLIALGCALLTVYATRWGAWSYSDTAAYAASARNLANGAGLQLPDAAGTLHPSVLTPPFYTWILAMGSVVGIDLLAWARILNILLVFFFIGGVSLLVWRITSQAWTAPTMAALLACFPLLFSNGASAMSEQLFFSLGFGGLLLLLVPGKFPSRVRWVLSAVLVGLAALTRYMGAAFIATALILVWLAGKELPLRRRLVQTALYALVASLPLLLWLGWTILATRTVGARNLGGQPNLLSARWAEYLNATWTILASWIPYGTRGANILSAQGKLALLLSAWISAAVWGWRSSSSTIRRMFLAALLFCLTYLLILALTYLFADIPPDLIPRMYSPLWPAFCLGLLSAVLILTARLNRIEKLHQLPAAFIGLALIVLVNVVYFTPQISEMAVQGHTQGVGYTARVWRESPVFERICRDLSQRAIISDEPALVLLYTGRGAYRWEEWVQGNLRTASNSPPPGQGSGRLHDQMRSGAALVIFPPRIEEEFGVESRSLLQRWTKGLDALYRGPEAEILLMPGVDPH